VKNILKLYLSEIYQDGWHRMGKLLYRAQWEDENKFVSDKRKIYGNHLIHYIKKV
jgi:urease accessory protein UreH